MDWLKATPDALRDFASKAGDGYVQLDQLVRGLADLRAAVIDEGTQLVALRAATEQLAARHAAMSADIAAVEELRAALQKGD